jgi:hypothetical protein
MWRGVSDAQWARVREHLPAWKADPRGGRPRRTHRLALLAHHDACRPCSSLFTFARERNDLGALAAWRSQLAEHLAADRERRDFDRDVLAQLTRPLAAVQTCTAELAGDQFNVQVRRHIRLRVGANRVVLRCVP